MSSELLQLKRRSLIGPDNRYDVLFELDSTRNYSYPVEYSAYIVKDKRTSRYKTLQILGRTASAAGLPEVPEDILAALDVKASSRTLRSHDSFTFKDHLCCIQDLRGPPLSQLLELEPDSASWSKKVFRDSLLALQDIHSCGIIHGKSVSLKGVTKFYGPREYDMNDFDDRLAAPYAATSLGGEYGPRGIGRGQLLDFAIKMQNLRMAGTATDDPSTSRAYQIWPCPAPEYLIEGRFSAKVDIWSLGILMTDVIAAAPHFVTTITKREEDPTDNLHNSQRFLGALPERYGYTMEGIKEMSILDELKDWRKGNGFADGPEQEAECDKFSIESLELAADLLMHMMDYDPEKRFSASQALAHRFFSTGLRDEKN